MKSCLLFWLSMATVVLGRNFVAVTPVRMPLERSVSSPSAQDTLIADAIRGMVKDSPSEMTDPAGYSPFCGQFTWRDMVYSTNEVPMWRGELFPLPPFDQEHGCVIWLLIEAWSDSGDDVSLSNIEVLGMSSDPDNAFRDKYTGFAMKKYGRYAVGIKSNGSYLLDNPGIQKCRRIITMFRARQFNCGHNQTGLNLVRDWIESQANFTASFIVYLNDSSASSTASISISGPGRKRPVIVSIGRDSMLSIWNGDGSKSYRVYRREAGSKSKDKAMIGVIYGDEALYIHSYDPFRDMFPASLQ